MLELRSNAEGLKAFLYSSSTNHHVKANTTVTSLCHDRTIFYNCRDDKEGGHECHGK